MHIFIPRPEWVNKHKKSRLIIIDIIIIFFVINIMIVFIIRLMISDNVTLREKAMAVRQVKITSTSEKMDIIAPGIYIFWYPESSSDDDTMTFHRLSYFPENSTDCDIHSRNPCSVFNPINYFIYDASMLKTILIRISYTSKAGFLKCPLID